MRKLVLAGLLLGLGVASAPVAAAGESGGGAVVTGMMGHRMGTAMAMQGRAAFWGHRTNGRWWAGSNAPGGWQAYRRPSNGFVLPAFWINPAYYIADYRAFALPAPAHGYGWSRYYDDAVLTDRYGRVVDVRYGYDWDRYGGYADGDDRPYRDGYTDPPYRDDDVTIGGRAAYEGRWVGTWYGRDGSTYSGVYDGRFEGGDLTAPALPYQPLPAYGDYSASSYYYQARPAVAVDYVTPMVTTFVTEEVTTYTRHVRKSVPRKRVWRARARPVCGCGCVCG